MILSAHQFLDDNDISYEARQFPLSTEKGAANVAIALGFKETQMVKTLIFELVDTGELVMIMVGGDQLAKSSLLKKAIGSKNISMSNPGKIKELTGYEVGSIPPFCWHPPGFRSFIEVTLQEEEKLGVGAGVWGEEIIMSPHDLIRATNAVAVPLIKKDE